MGGAAVFFTWELLGDLFRHHGHAYGRPMIIDDFYKSLLVGGGIGLYWLGPKGIFQGALLSAFILMPMVHVFNTVAVQKRNVNPVKIYYVDGVSEEE